MLRPLLVSFAISVTAFPAMAEDVSVFAAASLKDALDKIAFDYAEASGNTVTISYAGSNQLAKQIIEGAPADLFISANEQWMDEIEKEGMAVEGTRRDLLGNKLVLIAHGKDAPTVDLSQAKLTELLNGEKLAMALVDSVPAGQYGKAALEHLGQWESVSTDVAQSDNVRAALALVATGEAPYGIVYATDAAAEDNVTIVGEFPADSYPSIVYPAALLTEAKDDADKAFFELLSGDEASKAFEEQGFTILK